MANNSFLLKGWSITIVGALFALGFKDLNRMYVITSFVILFFFWLLDGYYLSRERLFIYLYDHVRLKSNEEVNFSMNVNEFEGQATWLGCAKSKTLFLFYGGLSVVHLLIFIYLSCG